MSRRGAIQMTEEEVLGLLDSELVMSCATNGRDGWPHVMALWYVVRDGRLWAWTYARSQKTRNLERDPRCTLHVEAGGGDYGQLRGVMIEAEATVHRDPEAVAQLGAALARRYGGGAPEETLLEVARVQAPKRVALEFVEHDRASWDHRKLGGTY